MLNPRGVTSPYARARRRPKSPAAVYGIAFGSFFLAIVVFRPDVVMHGWRLAAPKDQTLQVGAYPAPRPAIQSPNPRGVTPPAPPWAAPQMPPAAVPGPSLIQARRDQLIARLIRVIRTQHGCAEAYATMVPAFRNYIPSPTAEGVAARQARMAVAACGGAKDQLAALKAEFTAEIQRVGTGAFIADFNGQRRTLPADDGPALAIGVAQAFIATATAREAAASAIIQLLNQAGGPPPALIQAKLARADQEGFAAQNQLGQVMGARSISPEELAAAR